MRPAFCCALIASALLGLSACNKAESPDKVQADVAKAQSDAVEANAKAEEKQKQVQAEAAKDRTDAEPRRPTRVSALWWTLRLLKRRAKQRSL